MKLSLYLSLLLAGGFCADLCSAEPPRVASDLVSPEMTSQDPAAGERVRQVAPEYRGTEVYHALYLV